MNLAYDQRITHGAGESMYKPSSSAVKSPSVTATRPPTTDLEPVYKWRWKGIRAGSPDTRAGKMSLSQRSWQSDPATYFAFRQWLNWRTLTKFPPNAW